MRAPEGTTSTGDVTLLFSGEINVTAAHKNNVPDIYFKTFISYNMKDVVNTWLYLTVVLIAMIKFAHTTDL